MDQPMSFDEQSDVLTALAAAICYAMPDEQRGKVGQLLNAFAANRRQDGQQGEVLNLLEK